MIFDEILNQDHPEPLNRLLELTEEADQLVEDICGTTEFWCLSIPSRFFYSQIETDVANWGATAYSIRRNTGEPENMHLFIFNDNIQRLIENTRERDRILSELLEEPLERGRANENLQRSRPGGHFTTHYYNDGVTTHYNQGPF